MKNEEALKVVVTTINHHSTGANSNPIISNIHCQRVYQYLNSQFFKESNFSATSLGTPF